MAAKVKSISTSVGGFVKQKAVTDCPAKRTQRIPYVETLQSMESVDTRTKVDVLRWRYVSRVD